MRKLMVNGAWMDFRNVLRDREPFTTYGALRGVSQPYTRTMGQLPTEYRASLLRADYIVYSYITPIAWHVPGEGWTVPDTRYSVTTSKHQSKIRTAISQLGE